MRSARASTACYRRLGLAPAAGVALSLCGLVVGSPAQDDASPALIEHVRGVVRNSVDGTPVARVLVTSSDQKMGTMTDSEGRFAFDFRRVTQKASAGGSLQALFNPGYAGQSVVVLMARRPGYLMKQEPVRLAADPKTTSEEIELRIVPEGVVRGHVSVSTGELPANVQVMLMRRQVADGLMRWIQTGGAQINSRGEFRFAELQAGDYVVETLQTMEPGTDARAPKASGFLPSFFGDAADLSGATPLHVAAGSASEADIALRRANFYHVTIAVANVPQGSGVQTTVARGDGSVTYRLNYRAGGNIEGYLPDGTYDVQISAAGAPAGSQNGLQYLMPGVQGRVGQTASAAGQQSAAAVVLTVAGAPVIAAPVTLSPSGMIPVRLRMDLTSNDDAQRMAQWEEPKGGAGGKMQVLNLSLQPLGNGTQMGIMRNAMVSADGEGALPGVPEGKYRVQANAMIGYVAAMSSNGVDLLRDPLVVGPGGASGASGAIEVTLRDDFASLSGSVATGAAPQAPDEMMGMGPSVFLLCVSLDRPFGSAVQGFGSSEGKFQMPQMPPGEYLVLASRSQIAQTVEYRNPEVLRELESKGTMVTLAPGGKTSIQVPLMDGATK